MKVFWKSNSLNTSELTLETKEDVHCVLSALENYLYEKTPINIHPQAMEKLNEVRELLLGFPEQIRREKNNEK
jgi:hypothetical protein